MARLRHATSTRAALALACVSVALCLSLASVTTAARPLLPHETALLEQAAQPGGVRVLVTLNTVADTTSGLSPLTETGRRAVIAASQDAFENDVAGLNATVRRRYDSFPIVLVDADATALRRMVDLPGVRGLQEDHKLFPLDNATNMVIHSSTAWANNYHGEGQVVAVVDTGVQDTHPFLSSNGVASRVISSLAGCFSGDGAGTVSPKFSNCPGDAASATGSVIDGEPCYNYPGYSGCGHGTHIAGVAAGNGFYVSGNNQGGVAPQVGLMPVQVFTCYWTGSDCIETAYDSDVIGGLNWVNNAATSSPYWIASAVVAAGAPGIDYTTNCDVLASAYKTAIDALRNNSIDNVAVVIPSGNDGFTDGVDYPACVSSAITVAATDNTDTVDAFSNSSSVLSLYAPGDSVYSSIPTSTYAYESGTSMAAAQVAGSFALMDEAMGNSRSVDLKLTILQKTGKPISARGYTRPRVDIGASYDVIFVDGFNG